MVQGRRLPHTPRLIWRPHRGHEQAALDFVRHLFEGQLVAPAEGVSTRGRTYYDDTYVRIGHMAVRGALAHLVRSGGWARVRHVDRSGEKIVEGRIWDAPEFAHLEPTLDSPLLSLCTALFDAFAARQLESRSAMPARLVELATRCAFDAGPWGQLALHLVARPLAMLNQAPEAVTLLTVGSTWNTLTLGANPQLAVELDRQRLTEALTSWGWTLPWTSEDVAWWWIQADAGRFSGGLERFVETMERLSSLLEAVVAIALEADRQDWLLPVVDFFCAMYGEVSEEAVESFTAPLEVMTEGSSLRERQAERDRWGRLLRVMTSLGRERERIHRSHPVDREPHERLFLSYWEDAHGERALERVERMRAHLERVIS